MKKKLPPFPKAISVPEKPASELDWLKIATHFEYRIRFDQHAFNDVVFVIASRGGGRYAVVSNAGFVLSKSENGFVYEPLSSSRTDEFLADTRFYDLGSAWDALQAFLDAHDVAPGGWRRKEV